MTIEEKKNRIKILREEIEVRQKELDCLENEIINSSDNFREKFSIWANSGRANQLEYLPSGAVRIYCDDWICNKGRGVINILEHEEFEIYAFPNERRFDSAEEEKEYIDELESDKKFMAACAQMMKENFDSFAIDW